MHDAKILDFRQIAILVPLLEQIRQEHQLTRDKDLIMIVENGPQQLRPTTGKADDK
jgi:hypothetical protein